MPELEGPIGEKRYPANVLRFVQNKPIRQGPCDRCLGPAIHSAGQVEIEAVSDLHPTWKSKIRRMRILWKNYQQNKKYQLGNIARFRIGAL